MGIEPNATCLFILTVPNPSAEHEQLVLFSLFKPVEDVAPAKLHIYTKYGQGGKAKLLLKNIRLRQWFVVGTDEELVLIRDQLFGCGFVTLEGVVLRSISSYKEQVSHRENIYTVPGYIRCTEVVRTYTFDRFEQCLTKNRLLSVYYDIPNNLRLKGCIDDYGLDIFPLGIISLSDLDKYFESHTTLVWIERSFTYVFRGVRRLDDNPKGEDPVRFEGFVQASKETRDKLGVLISEQETESLKETLLGLVDVTTGRWSFESAKRLGKGIVAFYDQTRHAFVCAEKFYLVKHISVNVNPVPGQVQDLYGRTINISEGEIPKRNIVRPNDRIWFAENWEVASNKAEVNLSDYVAGVLQYCTPRVLIYDPYFIGPLKSDTSRIELTSSQKIFMNALIVALANVRLEEVDFLYSKVRRRSIFPSGNVDVHRRLFKELLKVRNVRIVIRETRHIFHDRHIVKVHDSEFDVFTLSTSVGGLVSSNELKIQPVEGVSKSKIYGRVLTYWEESADEEIEIV